jgi:hypothetical protein
MLKEKISLPSLIHSTRIICVFFLVLTGGCRNSFLKISPVPILAVSARDEFNYLEQTDKKDRRQTLLRSHLMPGNGKVASAKLRDQARMKRVRELYELDSVKTDDEKRIAALIYLHGCPNYKLEDTLDYQFSAKLFNELALNGSTAMVKTNGKIYKKIADGHLDELKKRFYMGRPEPVPILPHGH